MDFIECPPLISFKKKKLQVYKYIKIPKQRNTQIKKQKNPNNGKKAQKISTIAQ